jgi:hypothetical protein
LKFLTRTAGQKRNDLQSLHSCNNKSPAIAIMKQIRP